MQENNFKKMQERAVEIREKYSKTDHKQWDAEQVFMGMVKDLGDLSKYLMINGGYREDKNGNIKEKIEHELADILYCTLVLAHKTGVDLEKSFWKAMDEIEGRF